MAEDGKSQAERLKRERLAEALRQNLARRKGQARARRSGEEDRRPDGLPAAGTSDSED